MAEDLLTISNYQELVKTYHDESDRAAAILAASYLDGYLGKLMKHFMIDDPDSPKLFENYGPYASFNARIECSYALAWLNKEVRDNLHYIRKIRNHFAHNPAETSFDTSPVRDWCSCLRTSQSKLDEDGKEHLVSEPRQQFLFAVSRAVAVAHNTMLCGRPLCLNRRIGNGAET